MRKYFVLAIAVAFLLFVLGAVAQTSAGTHNSQATTTTTTTTTQQTTTSGPQRTMEGCVVKEASDYFLIPRSGKPIELQVTTGADLTAHEGHRVKIQGVESSLSAGTAAGAGSSGTGGTAGAAANMPPSSSQAQGAGAAGSIKSQAGGTESSSSGAASGTGNDLHRLSTRQMSVVKVTHVAETCPVNWNPKVSERSTPKQ
jgi:hypothetical protein